MRSGIKQATKAMVEGSKKGNTAWQRTEGKVWGRGGGLGQAGCGRGRPGLLQAS